MNVLLLHAALGDSRSWAPQVEALRAAGHTPDRARPAGLGRPEIAAILAAGIADTRVETIAGAGHLPSLERPDDLNRLLLDFLQ